MPKGKKKKKKESYESMKVMVYIRVGSKIYTSPEMIRRDIQKELALKTMTPEQIEFCERIKTEIKNTNRVPMVNCK